MNEWRKELQDYASDDCHRISLSAWMLNRSLGITLYLRQRGLYVAYFDDAEIIWSNAQDDLPMHHCNVRSAGSPRTIIHPLHIHAWLEHFASMCLPVQILGEEALEPT